MITIAEQKALRNRSGVSKVGLNPIQWTEVYSGRGTQEGAAKDYKSQK